MKLYARPGWGSAIVEYQLAFLGLPFERILVDDLFLAPAARAQLQPLNPLAQIPTLLLDDGSVLTESAAITLWLADLTGTDTLVPVPAAPERPAFLRWLVFLVANIYPCFTYADDPARFVPLAAAQQPFRDAVNAHEQQLWRQMDSAAGTPWFLGEHFSAIDIYLAVMTKWRPGRDWFRAETPKLFAIATAVEALPQLQSIIAANHDPLID